MADDRKLLAEWFWTDRWMGSSAFLLPIGPRGLYREMLTQAWRRGARLPNDHEAIRRAVGCSMQEWNRYWPRIAQYWRVDGDSVVNDTQVEVYAAAMAKVERASERGKKGAQARAQALAQADAQVRAQVRAHASSQGKPEDKPPSLSLTQIGSQERSPENQKEHARRRDPEVIGRFIDRYEELHRQYRNVAYLGNAQKDYQSACELIAAFGPDLCEAIAVYGLNDPDPFMRKSTVTITMLKSRASKYAEELKARKLA